MLIYPRAEHRPLGTQTEPRMTGHDVVCLHTMVGFLASTAASAARVCRGRTGAAAVAASARADLGREHVRQLRALARDRLED